MKACSRWLSEVTPPDHQINMKRTPAGVPATFVYANDKHYSTAPRPKASLSNGHPVAKVAKRNQLSGVSVKSRTMSQPCWGLMKKKTRLSQG
ncbi:MAG: hypothetical protein SGI71_01790 [Verrucomicrobiota bacterium]|nr:hypothetical protein [Verrucomicrobiota bacterium]